MKSNWVCSSPRPAARLLAIGLLLLISAAGVNAADSTRVAPELDSVPPVKVDTSLFVPPPDPSAAGEVTNPADFEKTLSQNPTAALFKSLVIPGWGQWGNKRRFKALVFAGLETWFIASAIHYGGQVGDAEDRFNNATEISVRNLWHDFLDNKRKNRNKFLWYAGITAFVSMFDAYVDAHLSGSPLDERNERIQFDAGPDTEGGVAASISYRF